MTLAKQIANWGSNLLVSGVVIVLALTFGRQTILWWRTKDTGQLSRQTVAEVLGPGALASPEAAQLLEFGDFPFVFQRSQVTGDSQAALAGLRRLCGQAASTATSLTVPPTAAETRALASLASQTPVAEEPGRWQMFENPQPLPMVLVATAPRRTTPQVVAADRRVLSWGLAFPRGVQLDELDEENRAAVPAAPAGWTLFVCSPSDNRESPTNVHKLPLPPQSTRTMTLRTDEGAAVVAIRGSGELKAWRDFVSDWARQEQWQMVGDWNVTGQVWHLRLQTARGEAMDIQLVAAENQTLRSLITVTPSGTGVD